MRGLLHRDQNKRLGAGPHGRADIKTHKFFRNIDWAALATRSLKPPIAIKVKDPLKAENFDPEFTSDKPVNTPQDPKEVGKINQVRFFLFLLFIDNTRRFWIGHIAMAWCSHFFCFFLSPSCSSVFGDCRRCLRASRSCPALWRSRWTRRAARCRFTASTKIMRCPPPRAAAARRSRRCPRAAR